MKICLVSVLALILSTLSVSAFAQDTPSKTDISGGFSLLREDGSTGKGWYGEFGRRVTSDVALVGEISAVYANQSLISSGSSVNAHETAVMYWAGPRFFFRVPSPTVVPFVSFLIGGFHTSGSVSSPQNGSLKQVNASVGGFAFTLGGGMDFRINKTLGLRIKPELAHSGGDDPANDFRFSIGFVWHPAK